jgi:hypothetical protein
MVIHSTDFDFCKQGRSESRGLLKSFTSFKVYTDIKLIRLLFRFINCCKAAHVWIICSDTALILFVGSSLIEALVEGICTQSYQRQNCSKKNLIHGLSTEHIEGSPLYEKSNVWINRSQSLLHKWVEKNVTEISGFTNNILDPLLLVLLSTRKRKFSWVLSKMTK